MLRPSGQEGVEEIGSRVAWINCSNNKCLFEWGKKIPKEKLKSTDALFLPLKCTLMRKPACTEGLGTVPGGDDPALVLAVHGVTWAQILCAYSPSLFCSHSPVQQNTYLVQAGSPAGSRALCLPSLSLEERCWSPSSLWSLTAPINSSSQVGLCYHCLQLELVPLHPPGPHLGAVTTSNIFFKHTLKKTPELRFSVIHSHFYSSTDHEKEKITITL